MDANRITIKATLAEFHRKINIRQRHCLSRILTSNLVLVIYTLYLRCRGINDKEIRFMQMIWRAKIRGRIRRSLRKYQR